jgi:hypothetical protein
MENTSAISSADLMLLLLKRKHKLTKEATEDISALLNIITGKPVVSSSMYKLEKEFLTCKDSVQVHHVCKKCSSHIGVVSADFVSCSVAQCGWKMSVGDSLTGGHFCFYLPLRRQLIEMMHFLALKPVTDVVSCSVQSVVFQPLG